MHGGNAPQVKAAREVRILTAEAAAEMNVTEQDAGEVLLSTLNDSRALLNRLQVNVANGQITEGAALSVIGEWIDRTARISKVVMDAGVQERMVRMSERQGAQIAVVVRRILDGMLAGTLEDLERDSIAVAIVEARWGIRVSAVVPPILRSMGRAEIER